MHPTNLAAVFEIARLIRIGLVQCAAFEQLLDLQLALAPQAGLLGRLLLNPLALAGFGLRAHRISSGQVDIVLATLGRARGLRLRMRLATLVAGLAGLRRTRVFRRAHAVLLNLFDDAALEQLIAQGIGHAGVPVGGGYQ